MRPFRFTENTPLGIRRRSCPPVAAGRRKRAADKLAGSVTATARARSTHKLSDGRGFRREQPKRQGHDWRLRHWRRVQEIQPRKRRTSPMPRARSRTPSYSLLVRQSSISSSCPLPMTASRLSVNQRLVVRQY